MLKLVLNSLPESLVPPAHDAYEVDTFLDPGLAIPALLLSTRAEQLLQRACRELKEYRAEAALRFLKEAFLEEPDFHDAHLLAGVLHAAEKRLEPAAESLQRGLSVEARSGDLIRRFLPTMRLVLRISRLHFFQLYPDYYGGSLLLAAVYGRLGKLREETGVLSHLRDLFGARDEQRVLVADLYLARGDYEAAISALEREEDRHRDELDSVITTLKGYCAFMLARFHQAAATLKSEAVHSREKNPYLAAIARFLYTLALEEDGLPVLALKESAKLSLEHVLNPRLRDFVLLREERLKSVVENLSKEAFFDASEFRWFTAKGRASSDYMEVLTEEYSEEDGRDRSWQRPGFATIYERLYRLGQQFRGLEKGNHAGTSSTVPAEPALASKAVVDGGILDEFDLDRAHEWCDSREGDEEFLRFDFRGTREPSHFRTSGERRLALIGNWGLVALFVVLLILVMRACS